MDIFKLIFHHDLLLEQLAGNEDVRNKAAPEMSLRDFMKPLQTYTRYYFTGTRLTENRFGLTILNKKNEVLQGIHKALGNVPLWTGDGLSLATLPEALETSGSSVIVASDGQPDTDLKVLEIDDASGVRDRIPLLKTLLDEGKKVIFLEKAHNGTDLHLFSRDNLYEPLFNSLKPLVSPEFRYFSINGKRMSGERLFYFETWTLDRPPHGFEEVGANSVM